MLKQLKDIDEKTTPSGLCVAIHSNVLVNVNEVKAVARLEPDSSGEYLAVGLYFSDNYTAPDIMLSTGGTEETEEFIKHLENTYRKNNMKVVKLNFKKEEQDEV